MVSAGSASQPRRVTRYQVMANDTQDSSEYLPFSYYQVLYHYDEKKVFLRSSRKLVHGSVLHT